MAMTLAACQTKKPPQPPIDASASIPIVPKLDAAQLTDWLDQADVALANNHLTYPKAGSALEIYRRILNLQPQQQDALRGLEHLVENYIELAMRALRRDEFATARSMLSRARIILPNHPSIEPTAEQIRLLVQADRVKLTLAQNALQRQDPMIVSKLTKLAQGAQSRNCRFTIAAKNDEQGRWVYQILSAVFNESRLRAQIRLRLPASVERICFVPQQDQ